MRARAHQRANLIGGKAVTRTVVAGALEDCVHVAGVYGFLRLAEAAGWRTVFLGPAVSIPDLLAALRREKNRLKGGDTLLAGISYRLGAETGARLLHQLAQETADLHAAGVRFAFGGTPAVAEAARGLGLFEKVFDGSESPVQVLAYLRGQPAGGAAETDFPQALIERIHLREPYPLLQHRFGPPTLEAGVAGIRHIAEAGVLDVVSLVADQDAQENLFHPERQGAHPAGTGGLPVRDRDDLRRLYDASRCGEFPLLQAASGSDDFIRYAQALNGAIHNAWCSVPLLWLNRMDGRGPWGLQASVREHQKVLAWHGERNVPVEVDEPQRWSRRGAPDVIFVVTGFLSAYNAKKCGVKDFIAQLVFGDPAGISQAMDLARMEALLRLIEPLAAAGFRIWRRTGLSLLSLPSEVDAARGRLAASAYLQMALRPHICQVVVPAPAEPAASAKEAIGAARIVAGAAHDALGAPEMLRAAEVQARAQLLMSEAVYTLEAIRDLAAQGSSDPWTEPATLARAVSTGVLDAPGLATRPSDRGRLQTRILNGGCDAVDRAGRPISEKQRLPPLL
jgi:hypothetical protein